MQQSLEMERGENSRLKNDQELPRKPVDSGPAEKGSVEAAEMMLPELNYK